MGLNVTYKGEQIARLMSDGKATLKLAGKTCEGDIVLTYSGGAGGISGGAGGISGGTGGTGGSSNSTGKDVVFYDSYDHSIVASYSAAAFAALSALPQNPQHAGLTAQGWNWTLEAAKAYAAKYGKLMIGQMFVTDDGKTRIHIHLEPGRTSPMLGACVNGTVTVDWGDGSEPDILTGTSLTKIKWTNRHNYASDGDYVIALTVDGSMAFSGSTTGSNLVRFSSNSDRRNAGYVNSIKAVEIGNGVPDIGSYAFYGCYSLTGVTIPNGVSGPENYAFQHCYNLRGITLPNGSARIGSYTFQNCYSLAYIAIPDGTETIADSAFDNCQSLAVVMLPESIVSIGASTFNKCVNLVSAVIPDGVVTFSGNAFMDCYRLSGTTIPDSVITIGGYAFSNCHVLTSVTIKDGVTGIGSNSFNCCRCLTHITLPGSITSILGAAFQGCQSLAEVHILAQTPPTAGNVIFNNAPDDFVIYVPQGTLEAYQAAAGWSTYADKMQEASA